MHKDYLVQELAQLTDMTLNNNHQQCVIYITPEGNPDTEQYVVRLVLEHVI